MTRAAAEFTSVTSADAPQTNGYCRVQIDSASRRVVRTRTNGPHANRSSWRSRLRAIARTAASLLVIAALQPTTRASSSPTPTEALLLCYKSYTSAYFCDVFGNCSMKWKLAPIQHRLIDRCVGALIKCQLTEETEGNSAKCFERAQKTCARAQETAQILGAGRLALQRQQVLDACSGVPFPDILATVGGIGLESNQATCNALGFPLTSIGDVIACADTWLQCEVAKLAALSTPRARDLLAANGWEDVLGPADCMEPALPGQASLPDRKYLWFCQKNLEKFSQRFVSRTMATVEECIDELFECAIEGDLTCELAARLCPKAIVKAEKEKEKFQRKVTKSCEKVDVDDLRASLGLAAPGHVCDTVSGALPAVGATTDLVQCLADELACMVDGIVQFVKPRAAELLGDAGLLDSFICIP
jgi:hypothetical protein